MFCKERSYYEIPLWIFNLEFYSTCAGHKFSKLGRRFRMRARNIAKCTHGRSTNGRLEFQGDIVLSMYCQAEPELLRLNNVYIDNVFIQYWRLSFPFVLLPPVDVPLPSALLNVLMASRFLGEEV